MNRHEFFFFYDVRWANPNGDPLADNQPRQDKIRERILVSDDRIKRTVRDALEDRNYNIFIKAEKNKDGILKTKEEKLKEIDDIQKTLLKDYVDIRLFGGVFAVGGKKNKKGSGNDTEKTGEENEDSGNAKKTKAFSLVGPIQIAWGESLHKVDVAFIKGTTEMPSVEGKTMGTFTEEYKVPYAFIGTYGVVNDKNATETGLSEGDIDLFFNALWFGHMSASTIETTSKLGHSPKLLIDIVFRENTLYSLGDLISFIKLIPDEGLEEKAIRNVSEFTIDLSGIKKKLEIVKKNIQEVRYQIDPMLRLSEPLTNTFQGLDLKEFNLI
ncbi:MAG: type I-B CRISPR-associated protein Cas7/Csh2 [Candidatus Parvarchaeota archaeon]